MSAITAKASRKMKKYAVLTREPRCFLGSFDFSWEQRKAKELFISTADKGYPDLPVLSATQDRGMIRRDENSINIFHDKKNEVGYKRVLPGQFVIHLRSFQGGFAHSAIEGITSPAYTVFGFSEPEKHDSEYWKYVFTSKAFIRRLETVTYGIRDGRSISYDEFLTLSFAYPSKAEQTAIARYLDKLSDLITLHQRKYAFLFRRFRAAISKKLATSTFSWEQRKLGDVVQEITRNDPESEAPIMMITANNGFIEQSERYAFNNAGESLKKYILLKKGELAYNHGASKLRPYGSCFALTTAENARIPFVYHCFSAENQNAEFMSIELNGAEIENQLRKIVSSGARMDGLLNISFDEYTSVSVLLPNTEEQDRIADFFRQLDHLITLHQRERISFSGRASRLIPPINKKRITSSWEQRKLSEMCGTFEYGLNAAAKEFDGKNKYIRITDIDDASREFLLSDLSSPDICLDGMSKYLLSSGDIVFARTGASVGKTYIYRENDGIVYFAGFLIRAKVNQDNDAEFVFQSTLSPSYEKYIRITSQRSGQPGVNAQEYGEYDLFAPSKEEQQRIGQFLRGIDHLITLHQRKPFFMKWRTSDANRNQTNRLVL